jgi:hypothetical protein
MNQKINILNLNVNPLNLMELSGHSWKPCLAACLLLRNFRLRILL